MQRPEIIGDVWLNSFPLTPEFMNEKLVLVHFWTYSCAKCLRALPHLRNWWRRYRSFDFLLIGIHTPEFEFEKDQANLKSAMDNLDVKWPIVVDNEYINWKNFSNQYWPAVYFFDTQGHLSFQHLEEGKYAETEAVIQEAVRKRFPEILLPSIELDTHTHGNACFIPTSEIHCGYARGHLDNSGGFNFDIPFRYRQSNDVRKDSIALLGSFVAKPEYVESASDGATLLLHFRATQVNLVLKPVDGFSEMKLTLNGKSLPENVKGRDVNKDSEVTVERPALYNLVASDKPLEGLLGITTKTGNFQAFVFTFSGCAEEKCKAI
jgi:thiol-disulfide isomerase/thioredoxin